MYQKLKSYCGGAAARAKIQSQAYGKIRAKVAK